MDILEQNHGGALVHGKASRFLMVTVAVGYNSPLSPGSARQLAAKLLAAADEVEASYEHNFPRVKNA